MQAFPTGNAKPTACPGWRKYPNTFKSWLILQGIWTSPGSAVMHDLDTEVWDKHFFTNVFICCQRVHLKSPQQSHLVTFRCSKAEWCRSQSWAPLHMLLQQIWGHWREFHCSGGQQSTTEVQHSAWGSETSGFCFIPHLSRDNCKCVLLLWQHRGIKCVLVREPQTPQNSVPCAADHKG